MESPGISTDIVPRAGAFRVCELAGITPIKAMSDVFLLNSPSPPRCPADLSSHTTTFQLLILCIAMPPPSVPCRRRALPDCGAFSCSRTSYSLHPASFFCRLCVGSCYATKITFYEDNFSLFVPGNWGLMNLSVGERQGLLNCRPIKFLPLPYPLPVSRQHPRTGAVAKDV